MPMSANKHDHHKHHSQLQRLRRIEGQVRGIAAMIEEGRYCVDVLNQLRAVRAAIERVEEGVLRDHVESCVVEAFDSGSQKERQKKIDELISVFSRYTKG